MARTISALSPPPKVPGAASAMDGDDEYESDSRRYSAIFSAYACTRNGRTRQERRQDEESGVSDKVSANVGDRGPALSWSQARSRGRKVAYAVNGLCRVELELAQGEHERLCRVDHVCVTRTRSG